jgi:GMP synthase-like glutamine amidotransferase
MRIAILQTGQPPAQLEQRFGGYPSMLAHLLEGGSRTFETYDVTQGRYPAPGTFDAILITGSPAGAYDPLPWIESLEVFLCAHVQTPMVGICFGHQIMAQAFGGKVEKAKQGWAIGLQHYTVLERGPWMDTTSEFAIPASHQDQVVEKPPTARVVAASSFTPYAALAYTDRPAISFQGHPEFAPGYAEALIEARRGTRFDEAFADAGIASLHEPNDRVRVASWIAMFLDQNAPPLAGELSRRD